MERNTIRRCPKIISLGIESTAHTFGAGIADSKGKILSNEKKTYNCKEKGIKPQEASLFLMENAASVIEKSLTKAGLKAREIDLIAFSQGPGLGPCLKVGATAARTLSLTYNIPIVPVNHCIAHAEIGKLDTNAGEPLIVYVSGGNTQIMALEGKKYSIFGETQDIGIGNMLDSFGRKLGIGFPAGPVLDKYYFKGKKYLDLPYTVKGMDLAFSGLETAATKHIGREKKEDISYSLLHNAFAMLTEVSERALAYTEKNELLLVGGVACSKALKKMMEKMCSERNAKLFVPKKEFCTDNGAMIAWLGLKQYSCNKKFKETAVKQRMRPEDTEIGWA